MFATHPFSYKRKSFDNQNQAHLPKTTGTLKPLARVRLMSSLIRLLSRVSRPAGSEASPTRGSPLNSTFNNVIDWINFLWIRTWDSTYRLDYFYHLQKRGSIAEEGFQLRHQSLPTGQFLIMIIYILYLLYFFLSEIILEMYLNGRSERGVVGWKVGRVEGKGGGRFFCLKSWIFWTLFL